MKTLPMYRLELEPDFGPNKDIFSEDPEVLRYLGSKAVHTVAYDYAGAVLYRPDGLPEATLERYGDRWSDINAPADRTREELAEILEQIAEEGMPGSRDLDAALDAILSLVKG